MCATLVIAVSSLLFASAANAHSEVRQRAPEVGQVLGGSVSHVDILFWVPVSEGETLLFGPDDAPLPVGETELSPSGLVTSVEFEPLTMPGTYVVEHTELAADGDTQTSRFQFVFDPDAEGRLASLIERSSGPNWVLLGGIALIVGALALFFAPKRT